MRQGAGMNRKTSSLRSVVPGWLTVFVFGCLSLSLLPINTVSAQPAQKPIWRQEFNGKANSGLSTKIWGYDLGGLNANSEEQFYTKLSKNIRVDGNGNLIIQARPIVEGSKQWLKCISCKFSSARIKTQDKLAFKYGRMEARIKMPAGKGTWPAFWMLGTKLERLGWPDAGEIDIVEAVGADPTIVFGTIHGPGYNGSQGTQVGDVAYSPTALSDNFHIYAVEWTPNSIKWFFDDKLYFTATKDAVSPNEWVFNQPFFLIVNLAMGGTFGGELDPNLSGATMYVDYIRYYKIGKYGKIYN